MLFNITDLNVTAPVINLTTNGVVNIILMTIMSIAVLLLLLIVVHVWKGTEVKFKIWKFVALDLKGRRKKR